MSNARLHESNFYKNSKTRICSKTSSTMLLILEGSQSYIKRHCFLVQIVTWTIIWAQTMITIYCIFVELTLILIYYHYIIVQLKNIVVGINSFVCGDHVTKTYVFIITLKFHKKTKNSLFFLHLKLLNKSW